MSKIISVGSSNEFSRLTSANTVVVVDFYADWCGPCKAIAPIFEQLARTHAKQGKVAFAKVNVDNHQDITQKYGVSAMPTFLILKNSTVAETIRGANPSALRSAVQKAASEADRSGPASGSSFGNKGYTLGTDATGSRPAGNNSGGISGFFSNFAGSVGSGANTTPIALGNGIADSAVRFAGLYLTTLFSFDAYAAAEASPFRVNAQAGSVRGAGRRL